MIFPVVPGNEALEMAAQNDQSQYMQIEEGSQQEGVLAAYQGQNVDMMA